MIEQAAASRGTREQTASDRLAAAPPSEAQVATVVAGIGPRLRALRDRHGLSLQQLADRSDVSPAAIHKVEQGAMVPTITTLLKLAGAFQLPVAHFIGEADTPASPVVYTPGAGRRVMSSPNGDVVSGTISADSGPFDLRASITEIAPGALGPKVRHSTAGESLVHVMSGILDFTVAGEEFRLTTSDSLHFRSEEEHSWRNPSTRTAKVVWVSLPDRHG